jgi:hypothetical protein
MLTPEQRTTRFMIRAALVILAIYGGIAAFAPQHPARIAACDTQNARPK